MTETIDDKDKLIIEVLLTIGDATSRQISKRTGIPATTVHHRIQRMKRDGTIKRHTIIPDYEQLGCPLLTYILINVSLKDLKAKKRTQEHVIKDLLKLHFVKRADIVSGGTDIVATVRTSSVTDYNAALLGKIQRIDGIESTRSLIVIKEGEK